MRWLRNLFSRPAAERAAAQTPAEAQGEAAPGWDSYRASAPEGPVAIALDLGLEAAAPDAARPRLVRLSYPLRSPGTDGQPDGTEGDALARVEDVLGTAMGTLDARYAGRVTLAGVRQHLFYLPDGAPVIEALATFAPRLDGYPVEADGEDDPRWQAFLGELLPPPRARRWMADRRELAELARHGDLHAAVRPVDHQASFPTAEGREGFLAAAGQLGFTLADRRDDGPAPNVFGVDLRRSDAVTLSAIHAVAWSLAELAARHGGLYDGWEAPVSRGA